MIKIDPEFQALIPPLSIEERDGLEVNIKAHGCRAPLDVWNGVLVDGHNRYEICTRLGIPFETKPIAFDSRLAAKLWILDNQFDRRNLDTWTRAEMASLYEDFVAAQAKERMLAGVRANPKEKLPEGSKPAPQTRDQVAAKAGISGRTYDKFKAVKKKATPQLIEAVKTGEVSISAAAEICALPKQRQAFIVETEKDRIPHIAKSMRQDRVTVAHVGQNSGEMEWYTPPEFIEAARAVMGSIDLDPASCEVANKTVKAKQFYSTKDDGLVQKWHGNVWMNPPYGQPLIVQFCEALTAKFESAEISQAVVLVNNATETEWFQTLVKYASALCFPRGRIKYLDSTGKPANTPLQGQAFLYFGESFIEFRDEFSQFGKVVFA